MTGHEKRSAYNNNLKLDERERIGEGCTQFLIYTLVDAFGFCFVSMLGLVLCSTLTPCIWDVCVYPSRFSGAHFPTIIHPSQHHTESLLAITNSGHALLISYIIFVFWYWMRRDAAIWSRQRQCVEWAIVWRARHILMLKLAGNIIHNISLLSIEK